MAALEIIALDTATPQLRAPGTGDTYSAPRALALTPETLTGSAATSGLSVTQTWNTTGTPTALSVSVTDTASNAASLLADFKVGGASKLSLSKTGAIVAVAGAAGVSGFYVGGNTSNGIYAPATSNFYLMGNGSAQAEVRGGGIGLGLSNALSWGTLGAAQDVLLTRDAANTLALRNGTNAQAFNVYNTYIDASNYELLSVSGAGTSFRIAAAAAGTGVSRSIVLDTAAGSGGITFATGGTSRWAISSSAGGGHLIASADNTCDIGASGANRPRNLFLAAYQEMSEMTAPSAPAANNVRIYAEDNGAGKTRLMALFATGVAQQLAVEP